MITRYIQKIVFVLLLFVSQLIHAQTYPVQAVPTVTSPYSSKLTDYSNAMVNRINLQLITTDLLVQNRPAMLQLRIQGNGINAQSVPILSGIQPIYLNGGEILSLTSADLAGYFRFQNLQGITTTRYSEPLPDGVYTICFQVYDMVTKKWLSQNSCATIYLMLNDPPQLNVPSNNEQIASSDFPNIIFSWTPRHMNATNVSYEFELKEILNTNLDPAFAFEVSPLLHKEEGLRTTTLLYDISKPVLIPGKTYAWRVKAISTNGLAENSVFKNNGYSQIYAFKYASNCTAPRYLLSEQQSISRVKIMWQGENSHRKYHVQYRKANVDNAEWFETYTVNTQTFLQDLEPGFTYEFRVGATCEAEQYGVTSSYIYSGIQTFSIDASENATAFNCGIVPEIEIANQQPLANLIINETFMAGDFSVKVMEISGSNGVYSGKGFIEVPYLFFVKIGVEFSNIRINTDYKLIEGMVETTYDPEWGNVVFIDNLWDVNQQSVTVNFPIGSAADITINNGGEIVVTGPDGQTETFPGGKDTVITDSEKNNYYVDANGNVSGPFESAPGGKPTPENTDGVNKNGEVTELTAEGVRVVFEKHTDTKFAFDQVAYNKELTSDYKKVGDAFVPFKAVPNGLTDKLWAKVTLSGTDVVADSVFFKTQNGIKIDAVKEGDHFVLTLKGAQKFALEEVQATIKQGDKYKIAGVFTMVHVSPKTLKLNLVPTTGVTISDAKINEIKAVYNQLAIDVDVIVLPSFDISDYLVGGKIPTEDTFGDLSTYSKEQNAIINAYKLANNVEKAYYIFVTDKTSSTGQSGYMKLNGQFGFVFDQNALTIAHELAHGAFKLEHPFKKYKNKGVNQGTTQSIMDYPPVANFLFTDWKQINDPAFKLYAFQGQSDGELAGKIWFTPDWKPFKIDNVDTTCNGTQVPTGTVPGIFVDGVCYSATFETETGKFIGYMNGSVKKDISYVTLTDNEPIYLYKQDMRYTCGPHPTYKAKSYKYAFDNKENIDYNNEQKIEFFSNWQCPQTNVNETYFDIANFELPQGLRFNKIDEIRPEIIDDAVTKLNVLIAKNNVGYAYETDITNNQLAHIYIDENVPAGGEELVKLDHRLAYLSEYTKTLNKGIDIYVLYQKVDMLFYNWNEYAKQVYTKSNLANKNAVLITVPYFYAENTLGALDSHFSVSYYLPGVYVKGVDIDTKNIVKQEASWGRRNQYLNPDYQTIFNTQVEKFIRQVYTQTYKPSVVYLGLRYANGTIEAIPNVDNIYKPGNAFVKTVILKNNKYYNEISGLKKPEILLNYGSTSDGISQINPFYEEELLKYELEKADLLELANENKKQDWLDYANSIQFKEKQLDNLTAAKYITGYAFKGGFTQWTKDLAVVYGGTTNSPPIYEFNNTYNKDGWSTVDPLVYGTIDVASLFASIVAADAIPESIGLFYALKRGDALNATLYTSAIVIPVLASGELRAGMIAKNLATDTKLFFRGSVFTLKTDGKLAKVSTNYTRGRILEFFKLSDDAVTPTEIDNFVSAFRNKQIKSSDIKGVLNEIPERRASKFKNFSKLVSNDIKVGDIIADVVVQQVKTGTSNKIIIIGRQMKGHVYKVADDLISRGKYVEVLDDKYLKKMYDNGYEFIIDGKSWTVNSAWDDMVKNPAWDKYRDAKGYIIDKYLDKTPMYKLNKLWIEKAQIDGATIIDIGYPKGVSLPISTFYEMEKSTVKWK